MNTKVLEATYDYDANTSQFFCRGTWSVATLGAMRSPWEKCALPASDTLKINGSDIGYFDSAGALALLHCKTYYQNQGKALEWVDFHDEHLSLIDLVAQREEVVCYQAPAPEKMGMLYQLGKETMRKLWQADGFVILVGDISAKFFEACAQWRRFQWPGILSNIFSAGIQALPIVGLLSFLIGVVLAYQMGLQLQTYGANIFIAYLSGMAVFREFGPLIAAIIVAGRTSSAFTAQIGSMKINEEVDALYTMGLSPIELLVMPKLLALLIVFPLIIFWSDLFSIIGAMLMSKSMLGIGFIDFLLRLKSSVGIEHFMIGMYKAPAFAAIIALVGCYQGFLVEASADSIGSQTTKSVVQALFLIIIADAVYSVVYSWMGL